MSEFYTVNRVKTIARKLNSQTSGIITICHNTGNPGNLDLTANNVVSVNAFVRNLKAYTTISSLAAIKMPNFELTDSDTEKLYKVLDVEWQSPRKQLNLYISDNSQKWEPVGSISLLNPSGYPYRIYNILELYTDESVIELGENSRLGVEVQDVGYGLLTGNDAVTIHGSYVEEITLQSKPESVVAAKINSCLLIYQGIAEYSTIALSGANNRTYARITNANNTQVYLNLGSTAIFGEGILLNGEGDSYEVASNYRGAISAISEPGTFATLAIIACS